MRCEYYQQGGTALEHHELLLQSAKLIKSNQSWNIAGKYRKKANPYYYTLEAYDHIVSSWH